MDLRGFLAAMFSDWVSLMSGIASIFLTIAGFYKVDQKRWFIYAGMFCFFIASVRVWTSEHDKVKEYSNPDLVTTIQGINIGQSPEAGANPFAMLWISITNRGTDSIAVDYTATVRLLSGQRVDCHVRALPEKLRLGDLGLSMDSGGADIFERTATSPVRRGSAVTGILFIEVPGVDYALLVLKGVMFTVSFVDAFGGTWHGDITMTGRKTGANPPPYLPGTPRFNK